MIEELELFYEPRELDADVLASRLFEILILKPLCTCF